MKITCKREERKKAAIETYENIYKKPNMSGTRAYTHCAHTSKSIKTHLKKRNKNQQFKAKERSEQKKRSN